MKVVNTSKKPFEFTFDSGNYGPFKPGEVVDLPDDVARHGIRRSMLTVLDDSDEFQTSYRLEPLDSLDKDRRSDTAIYACALVAINECNAPNFKTVDELMTHLRTHQAQMKSKLS